MSVTPSGIVAQREDPELRRHRREMLEGRPWLRSLALVLQVGVAIAVAAYLRVHLFG